MEQSKEIGWNEGINELNPKSKSMNIATRVHKIWARKQNMKREGDNLFQRPSAYDKYTNLVIF